MRMMTRESHRHDETAIIAHDLSIDHDALTGTDTNPAYPTASTCGSAADTPIERAGAARANDSVSVSSKLRYTPSVPRAHSADSNAACSSTVCVARSCLSGGYPYFLSIRLTSTRS